MVSWGAFESPVERGAVGKLCVSGTGQGWAGMLRRAAAAARDPEQGRLLGGWAGGRPCPSQKLEVSRGLALL